ncbi:protoporphyrinogen oxidase [Brevibacillus sp. GCM10020057]|uniref:protoporphyrinogen oxidase n=1 Tax=Brevibacillus sp. GCM10020057 TaxID=3317327 RepID=UPI00363BBCC6
MSDKKRHITIVGGGITGLAAAFYLQKEIEAKGLPIRFLLLEEKDRLGGKIQTWRHEGFVIEQGPDSFLERKTSAAQLAADLGLEQDLVRNSTGQAYIWHKERLMPIPEGAVMGVPTKLMPFVTTKLISWPGKLRAAADLILPATVGDGDISVGDFFRRRLGDEVIENLIQPLLSGVYSGDIDNLSLLASFPQFAQMEKQHRSLILAMKHSRPQAKGQGKPKGIFLTLKNGLESLVEGIESRLPAEAVRKNTGVQELRKQENGSYTLVTKDGERIETDAVLFTIPHAAAEPLLRPYAAVPSLPSAKPHMVATISLAFPETAVDLRLEGTGFIVPRNSGAKITACTWAHRKWPHTTPAGKALLRCFVGKAKEQSFMQMTDEEIVEMALHDLHKTMTIRQKPDFYRVTRLQNAIPYVVGHQAWVQDVSAKVADSLPGVLLAGASYSGVGVPDCIDQGKKAVPNLLASVQKAAKQER